MPARAEESYQAAPDLREHRAIRSGCLARLPYVGPLVTADVTRDAPEAGQLAELYVRHAASAQRLAYLPTGDAALAEHLAQEAFVRVVGRFAHPRVPDAFDTYLRRTIMNLHTSRLRRLRTERAYLPAARGRAPTSTADPIERERPWRALREPPPR